MKKIISVGALLLLFGSGCFRSQPEHRAKHEFPAPGTLIATAGMPVKDDSLNHFVFSVRLYADSEIRAGVYDVEAEYGPNLAEGKLMMPKGGEDFKPVIRHGSDAHSFVIGFNAPGDTTFYEYFQVNCSKATTKMQYIKAYTFN